MGIEPTRPAWKAGILPLNYTRILTHIQDVLHWQRKLLYQTKEYVSIVLKNFLKKVVSARSID